MKKFLSIILVALCIVVAGCTPAIEGTPTLSPGQTTQGTQTTQPGDSATPGETTPTGEATPTGGTTPTGEATPAGGTTPTGTPTGGVTTTPSQNTGLDIYQDGTGINLLVGVDEFGRVVSPVGTARKNKAVGMFYWLWHGTYPNTVVDTSKLIDKHGLDYVLHNVPEYNPTMQPHYWGEPLYGYYSSTDEYVLRKHLELLSFAGVDFIVFDATNTITYPGAVRRICDIILEMQADGFDVPQIAYYTHASSIDTVRQAYKEIYSKEKYRSTWFCVDGKPLMIGQTDVAKDRERTRSQHAHLANYNPLPLSSELLNFFYFRTPAWVGADPATNNSWPWVDWQYPPEVHGDVISVSCASHHYAMFSWAAMAESQRPHFAFAPDAVSWGRGYSFATGKNSTKDAAKGTFYQTVWDYALQYDPKFVFVGGWNEWMCGMSYNSQYNTYEWYDSFNMEFSRDVEMMKGGYNDAYLIQTAINARKYGYNGIKNYKKPVHKSINLAAGTSQWKDVDAVYKFIGSTNYGRNSVGAVSSIRYTQDAAKNAIQEVRITTDSQKLYFYIRTDGAISLTAKNSMNLFIGSGTPSQKGWESYEYVINRSRTKNTATVERLSANYSGKVLGNAELSVSGNIMQIAVDRSLLGITNETFYFKVADSVQNPDDIMDYYVTGRSMPMGRFSYQYLG